MPEHREIEPVERMRAVVRSWLACDNWSTTQLIDWFQGYDLPALGHDDEPYLWLLRGLPEGDERYAVEKQFACRAAVLLNERPDEKRPGRRPEQVLYNLFMLCAGLSCADELADPVFAVLERKQLKGKWRGVDLRTALKAALIANQKDSRLFPVFEAALSDGEQRFLTLDENDFLDAVRLMPPSSDKRGDPALDPIGKALKLAAERHQYHETREKIFVTLAQKIIDTYPGRPTWGRDLLLQAVRQKWPKWAIEVIPAKYPKYVSRIIESVRNSPYHEERSVTGVIVHGFAESALSEERPNSQSIEEAHQMGLKSLAVGRV